MTAIAFENVAEKEKKDNHAAYVAPNEDLPLWREYVKGLRVERAAAICSSGEVGLFTLLPTVRKELVLIDHAKASLTVAMLKYLLIKERGPAEAYKLLTTCTYAEVKKALVQVKENLPKEILALYNSMIEPEPQTWDEYERYSYRASDPFGRDSRGDGGFIATGVKEHWKLTPMRLIHRASAKLDKVKFVYGDMTKLEGQFDLLYLSNAMEHSNVDRKDHPVLVALDAKVKPGGFVLVASQRGDSVYNDRSSNTIARCKERGWEVVHEAKSNYKNASPLNWTQALFQVPAHKEAA